MAQLCSSLPAGERTARRAAIRSLRQQTHSSSASAGDSGQDCRQAWCRGAGEHGRASLQLGPRPCVVSRQTWSFELRLANRRGNRKVDGGTAGARRRRGRRRRISSGVRHCAKEPIDPSHDLLKWIGRRPRGVEWPAKAARHRDRSELYRRGYHASSVSKNEARLAKP